MSKPKTGLGHKIRHLRISKEWSLDHLARVNYVSRTYVCKLEKNKVKNINCDRVTNILASLEEVTKKDSLSKEPTYMEIRMMTRRERLQMGRPVFFDESLLINFNP